MRSASSLSATLLTTPSETLPVEGMVNYRVRVENRGAQPERVRLTVGGVPDSWLLYPREVRLEAGAVQTVIVTLTPPRHPTTMPGLRRLCLRAEVPASAWRWEHCHDLVIEPFYDIDLTLTKTRTARGWRGHHAMLKATLYNASNVALPVSIRATTDPAQTPLMMLPPDGTTPRPSVALTLAPGQTQKLGFQLSSAHTSLFKPSQVRVCVEARCLTIPALFRTAETLLTFEPLVRPRLVGIAAAVLVPLLCLMTVLTLWLRPGIPHAVAMAPAATQVVVPVYVPRAFPTVTPPRRVLPVNTQTLARQQAGRTTVIAVVPEAETELSSLTGEAIPPIPVDESLLDEVILDETVPVEEMWPSDEPLPPIIAPEAAAPETRRDEEFPVDEAADAAGGLDVTYALPAFPETAPDGEDVESYERLIQEVASYYNVDWRLIASMVYHESRFDPQALGRDGDMGLMQILPSTWEMLEEDVQHFNPWDPYANLMIGTYFLKAMQTQYANLGYPDAYWSLVAYNWGPTNLTRHLQAGGTWETLPYNVQLYAWRILTDATSLTAGWWQDELLQPVVYP